MIYKGRSCRGSYKICRAPNPDIIKRRGLGSYITFSTAPPAAGRRLTNKSVFTAFGLLWGEVNHGGGGKGKGSRKLSGNFCPSGQRGAGDAGIGGPPVSPSQAVVLGVQRCSSPSRTRGRGRGGTGHKPLWDARSRTGVRWAGARGGRALLRSGAGPGAAVRDGVSMGTSGVRIRPTGMRPF